MRRRNMLALLLVLLVLFAASLAMSIPALAAGNGQASENSGNTEETVQDEAGAIWLGGKQLSLTTQRGENWNLVVYTDSSGKTTYTLTLEGYSCGNDDVYKFNDQNQNFSAHLYSTVDLTVKLVGTNTLGSNTGSYDRNAKVYRTGIYMPSHDLTFSGTGTLDIKSYSHSIYARAITLDDSVKVNCTTVGDCISCSGIMVKKDAALSVDQTSSARAFIGIEGNSGITLYGYMYVKSAGNYQSDQGSPYAISLGTNGSFILVDGGTLIVNHEVSSNNSDGGQGIGIRVKDLRVQNGGTVTVSVNDNRKGSPAGRYAIYCAGQLGVDRYSSLRASTTNSECSAIYTKKLVLQNSTNKFAIISSPAAAAWNSTNYKIYKSDDTTPANDVRISGLTLMTVYLGKDSSGNTAWSYWDGGPWTVYTGDFRPDTNGPLGTEAAYVPDYCVVAGSHTMLLDEFKIKPSGASSEPFITLDGGSLTLKLKGSSYLTSKSNLAVLYGESSSKLTIVDSGDGDGSLSIETIAENAAAVGGRKLHVTINSGAVYASANYGAAFGGSATSFALGDNSESQSLASLTINGGYVRASSEYSPAIGSAYNKKRGSLDNTCAIAIHGGTVETFSTHSYAIGAYGAGKGGTILIDGGSLYALGENGRLNVSPDTTFVNSAKQNVYMTTVNLSGTADGETRTMAFLKNYGVVDGKDKLQIYKLELLKVSDLTVNIYDAAKQENVKYNYGTTDLLGDTLYVFLPKDSYAYSARVSGISETFRPNLDIQVREDHTSSGTMYRQYTKVDTCYGILAFREVKTVSGTIKQYCLDYNETSGSEATAAWVTYDPDMTTFDLTSENGETQTGVGILVLSGEHAVTLRGLKISNSGSDAVPPIRIHSGKLTLTLDGEAGVSSSLTYSGKDSAGAVIELGAKGDSELVIQGTGILYLKNTAANGQGIGGSGTYKQKVTILGGRIYINAKQYGISADNITVEDGTLNISEAEKKLFIKEGGSLNILGGSVQGDSGSSGTGSGSGSPKVILKEYSIEGLKEIKKIDKIVLTPAGYDYNTDLIYTDENGKIYIWLPEGTEIESITIDGVTYYFNPETRALELGRQPVITVPTADKTVFVKSGSSTTLSVTATGLPALTFQWQLDKGDGSGYQNLSGATQASYTVTDAAEGQTGWRYRCIATNVIGSATSPVMTLCVNYAARITSQPADITVKEGSSASFSVTAKGCPAPTYQWYVDKGNGFEAISGATSAAYETGAVTKEMHGWQYKCRVQNDISTDNTPDVHTVESQTAGLTVYYAAEITKNPQDYSLVQGSRFTFTVEAAGRPNVLTYQWQLDKNDGNGFTDIEGANSASYSAVATLAEMDGWQYQCVVSNDIGLDSKSDVRTACSNPAVLHVTKAYADISQSPDGGLQLVGSLLTFQVETNIENPVYTWYAGLNDYDNTLLVDGEEGKRSLDLRLNVLFNQYSVWCVVTGGEGGTSVTVTTKTCKILPYLLGVASELPFSDVADSDWFYEDVEYVYNQDLMNGTDASYFSPDMTTTRAMVVTVLWRMENCPDPWQPTKFDDVADGLWYSDAVAWASGNGIVTGYGDGTFGPDDTITREQFAAILWRYAKYRGYDVSAGEATSLTGYTDVHSVSAYALSATRWAVGTGLMQGTNNKLNPAASATRAQVAAMLHRFCENIQ